jgi:hypothetical protein
MTVIDVTERPVLLLGWPDPDRVLEPTGIASGSAVGSPSVSLVMSPAGIAGGVTLGAAAVAVSVHPDGVPASDAVGDPQVDVTVTLTGIPSALTFGDPEAFTSMNPSGFDAAGAGTGTPKTTAVMAPDGIGSTAGFGDVETLATVFIIPGPVDPSNDFGTVNVIRKGWLFRPPVNTYQWRLFKEYEGISLLKENGVWSEVAHPDLERTRSAQVYLAGGRDHFVDDATKAELIAEGYTVTEEIIP